MLTVFIEIWVRWLKVLVEKWMEVDRVRAVEEGRDIVDTFLIFVICVIDYALFVDLEFGDYVSAFIIVDCEVCLGDECYDFCECVRAAFAAYGIAPASTAPGGYWKAPSTE